MAKTAQFNIKINGTDQLLDLNSVIDLTAKSLETLKTKKEALDKAFSETDFGTDEFNKIQAELKQTNSELKIFEEQVEGLNTKEQVEGVTKAFNALGSKYLPEATLYVTLEPCLMCAGAIYWSKLGRIVYGADDEKNGYKKTTTTNWPFHPKTELVRGVLQDECAQLMKDFFLNKR